MKKLLSVILAIVMVVSLLPATLIATHALSWNKVTSIAVGDEVILVADGYSKELSDFSTYGVAADYTDAPTGAVVLTVVDGASEGTYAFQYEDSYLSWSSGNTLSLATEISTNSSWTVSFDESGNAVILNVADSTRKLQYNSSNPRFACYTSSQKAVQLYALGEGCSHANAYEVEGVDANCTENGYTAGTYCPDCKEYIEGHEEITKLGHSNEVVVTPPTVTEQGYTTYTCTVCGSSYVTDYVDALGENYTVTFVVPEGAAAIEPITFNTSGVELPAAEVPASFEGYEFAGWATASVATTTEKPVLYTGEYYNEGDITLYAVYTIRIGGTDSTDYVLTDISKIPADAIVVITMTDSDGNVYALSSANGTSKAPAATTVTLNGNALAEAPADELKWNIVATDGGYIIYVNGSTDTWLYCTSSNNGVRVGTNSANVFVVDDASGYLQHVGTSRYVGVYLTTPDWRCYTNTTGNTKDQILGLYALYSGGEVYYSSVGGEIEVCEHENTYEDSKAATCTEDGYVKVICSDCGVIVNETVIDAGHSYENNYCTVCGQRDPSVAPDSVEEILKEAYALEAGESLLYSATLTGKIISIDTAYSEEYGNITVTIVVEDDADHPIMCFRLAGEGADTLAVEDVITVTGTLTNYSGTVEFKQGCTLDAVEKAACQHTETVTDMVDPTCTEPGSVKVTCVSCGETISEEPIAELGHSYDGNVCTGCGKEIPYITIYFQNNWLWTDVCLYLWGSELSNPEWPGIAMEYYGNDGNYDIYSLTIPSDITGIIINGVKNDGSESLDQTPDITEGWYDGICYYMTWNDGNVASSESIDVILPPECAHENTTTTTVDATCTTDGSVTVTCDDCGETVSTEVIPAAHTYDNNCDWDCNACGEYRDAPHTLTEYVEAVVPANCQEEGHVAYWICADCGGYFENEDGTGQLNPAWMYYTGEHVRPEGVAGCAIVACELCGEDSYGSEPCVRDEATPACQNGTCVNCGGVVYSEGHSYGYDEEGNSLIPLCLSGECIYCGETLDYIYEHENNTWAPCIYDGECVYGCGKEYPATGEHAIDDPCVGGTCWMCWQEIAPAHEYFYPCDAHCMNCGELTNPDATHNVIYVEAVEATCQANGNVAYWTCSDCGTCWLDEALTQQTNRMSVITYKDHEYFYPCDPVCMNCYEITNPDATHNVIYVEAVEATCQANGNVAYWTCSDCGACWLDEACTQVTNRFNVVTFAEHEYFYACDAYCMNCGELTNEDAAHAICHVDAVAATCTTLGNVEYWYCEYCGGCWLDETLMRQTNRKSIITFQDHNYVDGSCEYCGEADPDYVVIEKVEGLTATEIGSDYFNLEWTAIDGATKYWVYINGNIYASATDSALAVTNRKEDTTYTVSVIALLADGTILNVANADSIEVQTTVKEVAEAIASVVTNEDGYVEVSWNEVDGSYKYWIYIDGQIWCSVKNATSTVITRWTAAELEGKAITVKGINADGIYDYVTQ